MIWTTRPRSDLGPLAAITAGSGTDIVLLHGVGLRAEAWGAQLDVLARVGRVTAVDLPGHGQSARLPGAPTLTAFTDSVAGLLDAPAVVIGHSFGAMIALDLAVRHPAKVRAVAALNAIHRRSARAAQAVRLRAQSLDGITVANPEPTLMRWFGAELSPQRASCAQWLRTVDPAGYRAAYGVFAAEDGSNEDALRRLACPALFVTGALEPNSTPAMSHAMAGLAPLGRAEILGGAAHMLPMTHADALEPHLLDLIRQTASCLP